MAYKTKVESIRLNELQIEKFAWLKSKRINHDAIIRRAFDEYFEKEYGKYFKSQVKLPF